MVIEGVNILQTQSWRCKMETCSIITTSFICLNYKTIQIIQNTTQINKLKSMRAYQHQSLRNEQGTCNSWAWKSHLEAQRKAFGCFPMLESGRMDESWHHSKSRDLWTSKTHLAYPKAVMNRAPPRRLHIWQEIHPYNPQSVSNLNCEVHLR